MTTPCYICRKLPADICIVASDERACFCRGDLEVFLGQIVIQAFEDDASKMPTEAGRQAGAITNMLIGQMAAAIMLNDFPLTDPAVREILLWIDLKMQQVTGEQRKWEKVTLSDRKNALDLHSWAAKIVELLTYEPADL